MPSVKFIFNFVIVDFVFFFGAGRCRESLTLSVQNHTKITITLLEFFSIMPEISVLFIRCCHICIINTISIFFLNTLVIIDTVNLRHAPTRYIHMGNH